MILEGEILDTAGSHRRDPTAFPECLRRSWLLSLAAPYIERTQLSSRGPDRFALLGLSNEDLAASVAPRHAQSMVAQVEAMGAEHFADKLSAARCWAVCRHDDRYPATLRVISPAPWALIARGDPALLTDIAWAQSVSIVGSRRATSYGREVARSLGHELTAGRAFRARTPATRVERSQLQASRSARARSSRGSRADRFPSPPGSASPAFSPGPFVDLTSPRQSRGQRESRSTNFAHCGKTGYAGSRSGVGPRCSLRGAAAGVPRPSKVPSLG